MNYEPTHVKNDTGLGVRKMSIRFDVYINAHQLETAIVDMLECGYKREEISRKSIFKHIRGVIRSSGDHYLCYKNTYNPYGDNEDVENAAKIARSLFPNYYETLKIES